VRVSSSIKTKVAIGLGIMYVAWGTTYIGIAFTIETMPPLLSMSFRFVAASLALFAFIGLRSGWDSLRLTRREFGSAIFLGVLMLGTGLGTMALAEKVVPIGVASLIVAAMPIWTALFRTLDRDRPKVSSLIGIAGGLIGIGIIMLPGQTIARPDSVGQNVTLWMFIILFGILCWSLGSFLAPRMETPSNPLVLSTYEMAGAAAALFIAGMINQESISDFIDASARSWGGWIYLVTVGSLIGYTVYTWLLENAPITLVSTYAYVNPVVAVALGIVIFNETLTSNILIGGFIVIVSVVIVVAVESAKKQTLPQVQ
jgi:drug/metabolite transporter (DMT)-like permease